MKQRRARLRFAKDHKDWTVEDWSKVIFSYESNFQLCPTPGHLMLDGVLERPTSHSVSHPLWNLVDDLGMLHQGWIWAHLSLWRVHETSHVSSQGYPRRKLSSFCSNSSVHQLWGLYFPAGQCSIPHSQVNQGVNEDHQNKTLSWPAQSPDQTPLKTYDQEEDG